MLCHSASNSIILKVFYTTTGPVKTHICGLFGKVKQSCWIGPSHMTNMAAMPKYGKKNLKIFSRIKGSVICRIGNRNITEFVLRITFAYFKARSKWGTSVLRVSNILTWPRNRQMLSLIQTLPSSGPLCYSLEPPFRVPTMYVSSHK